MNAQPTIMKFGGTSVEDAAAFERVRGVVSERLAELPVVVVSAMSRVTDALLEAGRLAGDVNAASGERVLEEHFERHLSVARELLSPGAAKGFRLAIERVRGTLGNLLREVASGAGEFLQLQDEIVSYGERLSSALLAEVLCAGGLPAQNVDARSCIVTDDEHGCASPQMQGTTERTRAQLQPLIAKGVVPVLGGFIASSADGVTTTLGRGGSDYSAAIIGAALGAREIQIWTDVCGVLTADPRVVATARTIPQLSYAEAAELAFFGAKVLHPKTILPAVVRRIPVRIADSRRPEKECTVVHFETETAPRTVKAIAHKTGITIVHVTSARMLGAYGFLRALFEVFDRHRTAVDLVTTSEVSVSLSLDDAGALDAIVQDLQGIGAVKVEHGRALVCVVGDGLRDTPGIAAKVFTAIRDINVLLISQGASHVNLTFVVEEEAVEKVVRRLHRTFFETDTRELYRSALLDC